MKTKNPSIPFFIAAIFASAFIFCSCTATKVKYGEATFSRWSFGTKVSIPELNLQTVATNNSTNSLSIKGYNNDASAAIGIAVDAAVNAAIKAVKP